MIEFALKTTKRPDEIRKLDMTKLREAGLDDAAIVDLVSVISYFNFVNRIALGLGVRLDEKLMPAADPEELKVELARLDEDG